MTQAETSGRRFFTRLLAAPAIQRATCVGFTARPKAREAAAPHQSSRAVIRHRLLRIAQEDGNQCKAKLIRGQKLTKMKQLVQNWIWIPIMIKYCGSRREGLFVGTGFFWGTPRGTVLHGLIWNRKWCDGQREIETIHVQLVISFVSQSTSGDQEGSMIRSNGTTFCAVIWGKYTEESTKHLKQTDLKSVCLGDRFWHLLFK